MQMEGQTLLHRNLLLWSCPSVQQEKPQKKSQIKHCLTTLNTARAICWKYAGNKGDRMLHMLEVCEVRSSFLKLMIMITHIKMMQIPYLDIWSMLLSTRCLIQAIQVISLRCSKICYSSNIISEENNLPLIIT